MVANKPIEVALNEIVTRARVFTDAGGAAIALRDGDDLVTRASSGGIAPDVGARMSVENSLTGQAVLKGVPIHVEDSDKDPRVDAEVCRQLNTRSFIITPIAGSTTMLGVLAVFAPTGNAFTRTDLAVLRTMADQIATALGGGAYIQQLWPSTGKADQGDAVAAPEFVEQAAEPAEAYEPPVIEPPQPPVPPRRVAPPEPPRAAVEPQHKKPVADVQFSAPAPEPKTEQLSDLLEIPEIVKPASAKPEIRRAKAPAIPVVEPKPPKEEIEPMAQAIEPPKVAPKPAAPRASAPVATPKTDFSRKREEVEVKSQPVKAHVKPVKHEDEYVEDEEAVESATVSSARMERAAARAEAIEWKGLSVEPEKRSMGKFVVVAVVLLLVAGGAIGAFVFRKSANTKTANTTAPAATSTAPAVPSPATTAATMPAPTAQNKPATEPAASAAKPAAAAPAPRQEAPAMIIGRGANPNPNQAQGDVAPPQLAFSGGGLQLPDTNKAAMPQRAASTPIPAQVIRRVAPTYPDLARQLRQKGNVELQAQVLKDGTVGSIEVISGAALLRPAAVAALKQWRYRPAQLNGAPVESSVRVTISFDTK